MLAFFGTPWGKRLSLVLLGALIFPAGRATYRRLNDWKPGSSKAVVNASEGKALYLAACAGCHGVAGGGGRGPALETRSEITDEQILKAIREGVPGSTMPAFHGFPDEERNIVAYIRILQRKPGERNDRQVSAMHSNGEAERGSAIYQRMACSGCHRIGQAGSVFGPDLTRVGASRSYDYLKRSLIDPSADIAEDSQGVTAILKDGRRIQGVRVNEDTFTIQIRDASQHFVMLDKEEIGSLTASKHSLMPAYGALPSEEVEHLVAYLGTLRGTVAGNSAQAVKAIR
jgi:putative heme-binding domain-containing protein